MFHVVTFYKFVNLPDAVVWQDKLQERCMVHDLKGTILLATEGINATVAGSKPGVEALLAYIQSDLRFADLEYKESIVDDPPFNRLKVKVKSEIVTLGILDVNPAEQVGTYVTPDQWNELIADPDVIVIDTRNQYEVEIGSFSGAENPQLDSFRQFPEYARSHLDPDQHKKVAMFCTGGIRCEKATSFLLNQGFQEVYHLKGGILKYLEDIPPEQSLWQGECFVFDQRVAVKHGVEPGSYDLCRGCGQPLSVDDKASPYYQPGLCCHRCHDRLSKRLQSRREKRRLKRSGRSPQIE
jgi:UPF0176 protein